MREFDGQLPATQWSSVFRLRIFIMKMTRFTVHFAVILLLNFFTI